MLFYNSKLKTNARKLRSNLTDAETRLWSMLRRKQLNNVRFYRQKPIGNYIVDFYSSRAKLVIEIDGGQHYEEETQRQDKKRDAYLMGLGLKVLRFDNIEVLKSIENVLEKILEELPR